MLKPLYAKPYEARRAAEDEATKRGEPLGTAAVQCVPYGFPRMMAVALYPAEPASRILTEAAGHLRSLVEIASRRTGIEHCRKSLIGSVAVHPVMRQLIGLDFVNPLHPPERGAVIWARQQVKL